MTTMRTPRGTAPSRGRPITTWAFMALALIVVLFMPDWTESGTSRPLWLFALPVLLGIVGAVFAVRARRVWWAVASALWGFALVQILIIVVTLVSGP